MAGGSNPAAAVDESELELGLGLSIGGRGGGGGWGECGRILTAKDFPCVGSKRAAADAVSHDTGSPPCSSQVVGWPPIGAHRMNSLVNQSKTARTEEQEDHDCDVNNKDKKKEAAAGDKDECKSNDAWRKKNLKGNENGRVGLVKVNLDTVPIGRKVDLNAHSCYESLAQALEDMFFACSSTFRTSTTEKEKPRPSRLLDGSSEFVLTYEDKEGDWMLVGDVPWRMFLSSVRRLRIMRTSEANGLAPRFQERNERQRSRPVQPHPI